MQQTRRNWLRMTGGVLAGVALAGCSDSGDDEETEPATDEPDEQTEETPDDEEAESEPETAFEGVDVGVVSEWNAIRTRLRDPVILGHAGEYAAGASVVGDIFQRFENASGEHNAHEALEETSEENYAGFEEALGQLRDRLEAEDLEGAHEEMRLADGNLREAQIERTDEQTGQRLTLLVMGAHIEDTQLLLEREDFEDAAGEFSHIGTRFEESGLHEMVAEADPEAADGVLAALDSAASAAEESDLEGARTAAHDAFDAAARGLHALAEDDVAGTAHMAALQGRGWDAAALARLGGPSLSFAHAASLNEYRARTRDAVWLFEAGSADAAQTLVQDGLERFETARAHDGLEEADGDAYESFEGGLESLLAGIEAGDQEAVTGALGTIDDALRSGIAALVPGQQQALLEAGYAKIRIEDAAERHRLGDTERATEIVQSVLADFEADAGTFHETLEETSEELYETFEHDHLEALIEALQQGDDEAVTTHVEGIREALLSFETELGSRPGVSGVESGYMTARALDAVVLDELGASERASTVVSEAFAHFESGAGGFHEAIEAADRETYEAFEEALSTLEDNLGSGEASAGTVAEQATAAIYAIVEASGGTETGAGQIAQDIFAHFEEAAVHDLIEEADQESYESFEGALESYVSALESGSGVESAADRYADASLRAQFAVAGAPDEAPVDSDEGGDGGETTLEGGPNVVEGVPDRADHVVDMHAVSFDPEQLTVQQGDTVAWRFAGGEPHSVTAYEDEIPEDAEYWASGEFESESAAREGWENGVGAVQEGQSYVRTFETVGEHGYVCIPHEIGGMVGTVVVEE